MTKPDHVILWLPRADERELAASLGMCEKEARDRPGTRVRVHRWHVWRVVRAMVRLKTTNTPDGRSAAYALLAQEGEDRE